MLAGGPFVAVGQGACAPAGSRPLADPALRPALPPSRKTGARAALPTLSRTATLLGAWLRGLLARAHGNAVVVALASELARIARALLRNETEFVAGGLAAT